MAKPCRGLERPTAWPAGSRVRRAGEGPLQGLAGLTGRQESGEAALGRETLGERAEQGRLAGLPGGVDDEVLTPYDQRQHAREPALRGQHVVLIGPARTGGIEVPGHGTNLARRPATIVCCQRTGDK